jgi:nitrogen fixation/metabolism regulation signal transduction histidine kinase
MSDASSTATADDAAGKRQRSARNYLIDRHFQLKYAGLLAGTALLLSAALGLVLWNTSSKVIEQSQRTVEQGKATVQQGRETVRLGQQVLEQSRKVSAVVKMNIAEKYKDDPELAKTFGEESAQDEAKLASNQKGFLLYEDVLRRQAEDLERQAEEVQAQQRALLEGIVALLALLVLGVGVAGIVFTHKVAGPIFKMKRLLRQVGEGKLVVRERLRKGDELQHFFETFEKMVEDLRGHQSEEIAKVDEILSRLEAAPVSVNDTREMDADGVALLKQLRGEMQAQLEA